MSLKGTERGEVQRNAYQETEESSYHDTREFTSSPPQACVEGKTHILTPTDRHINMPSHVHTHTNTVTGQISKGKEYFKEYSL